MTNKEKTLFKTENQEINVEILDAEGNENLKKEKFAVPKEQKNLYPQKEVNKTKGKKKFVKITKSE